MQALNWYFIKQSYLSHFKPDFDEIKTEFLEFLSSVCLSTSLIDNVKAILKEFVLNTRHEILDIFISVYGSKSSTHLRQPRVCFHKTSRLNMKAVQVNQFGGVDVLQVKDKLPLPKPLNNQVLVRVYAAGVNPVDTYLRAGQYKVLPTLPFTPGKDGAGVVEESNCDKFKKGERVYFRKCEPGSYGEYTVTDGSDLFPLHDSLTFSQGAALGIPYFTAYRALVHRCAVKAGESVLVHGASGAVGQAACQIARALGLTVYGTAGTPEGLKLVFDNGAHTVFNHREENYMDKIKAASGGLDNIIEMLANVNLEKDLDMMKVHGRIAIVGNRGTIEINPRGIMAVESSIHGVMMGMISPSEIIETAAFLKAGQEAGWLKPTVGQEYTLDEASKAHSEVISHSGGTKGKIVLKIP